MWKMLSRYYSFDMLHAIMSVKDKRFIIILLVRGGWKLAIIDVCEVAIVCYVIT